MADTPDTPDTPDTLGTPATLDAQAAALADGLFPHQIEGVAFLLGRRRAILADDMGLGKTRQAIVSLRHLTPGGPRLVVCPASVKRNWAREIAVVAPDASILVIEGTRADRPDGRVGHRQLRHPRTAHRRSAARAVGGARVRRSALPEEPHQRAKQAVAPADDRCRRVDARARRAAVDRHSAHQPASRSLRAAAAGGPSARPQLSLVRETLLRGRERGIRLEDRRRLEHRRADRATARRHAAALERRRARAAAETADVAAGRRAFGHRRARDQEGLRAARREGHEARAVAGRRASSAAASCSPSWSRHARRSPSPRPRPRSTSSRARSIRAKR